MKTYKVTVYRLVRLECTMYVTAESGEDALDTDQVDDLINDDDFGDVWDPSDHDFDHDHTEIVEVNPLVKKDGVWQR